MGELNLFQPAKKTKTKNGIKLRLYTIFQRVSFMEKQKLDMFSLYLYISELQGLLLPQTRSRVRFPVPCIGVRMKFFARNKMLCSQYNISFS